MQTVAHSTHATSLPNGLSSDIERLLRDCRNDDDLVGRLKVDIIASQRFLVHASADREWCTRNQLLLGRIIQIANDAKERMRVLGEQVSRAVDDILTNGEARKKAMCESLYLMIAFRRQTYDLDKLYAELSLLPLPIEFKILAITGPLARINEMLMANLNTYGMQLVDSCFDRINNNVISEVQRFYQHGPNEALIDDLNEHSLLWEKLIKFIGLRCHNGDFEFLLRDLRFLGLPECMKELALLLRENRNQTPNVDKFKREFETYKATIKDKFPLYTALQKLSEVYRGPQAASAAMSIPGTRMEDSANADNPARAWQLFVACVKEHKQSRCDELMKKLAATTLPIHYKILAICPEFETVIKNNTWPDHFIKYHQSLSAHDRQTLNSVFESPRSSVSGSPGSRGGSRLSISPPGAAHLSAAVLPRVYDVTNVTAAAAAAASSASATDTSHVQEHGDSRDE